MFGLLGKKVGMTQVYDDKGELLGVTVIEAGPCAVLSVSEKNVQLGFDAVKPERLKKPQSGLFKKLNITARKYIRELPKEPGKEYTVGQEVMADIFKAGDLVDVSGVTKGKGFQGGMKRWHWKGGPKTHGSTSHRRVGSIGSSTTPGRVIKGHHMPGHMGNSGATTQNLKVVRVDAENNLILVNGAVAGHKDTYLIIRKAIKSKPADRKK